MVKQVSGWITTGVVKCADSISTSGSEYQTDDESRVALWFPSSFTLSGRKINTFQAAFPNSQRQATRIISKNIPSTDQFISDFGDKFCEWEILGYAPMCLEGRLSDQVKRETGSHEVTERKRMMDLVYLSSYLSTYPWTQLRDIEKHLPGGSA